MPLPVQRLLLLPLLLLLLLLATGSQCVHVRLANLRGCRYPISAAFTTLDCSGPELGSVPTVEASLRISAYLQHGSPISSIPAFAFANSSDSLQLLSIASSSQLQQLHPLALRNLTQLRSLSLSGARPLAEVPAVVDLRQLLLGLRSLHSLQLANVQIGSLAAGFAADCRQLRTVQLQHCGLVSLQPGALPPGLTSVVLADNPNLPLTWTEAAPASLRNLTLRACGIKEFRPPPALSGLLSLNVSANSMRTLDLTQLRNSSIVHLALELNSIGGGSLPGLELLTNLEDLVLTTNSELDRLPPGVAGLRQLRHLDLRATGVSGLLAASFNPEAELRTLLLDYSPLDYVEVGAFARLRRLRHLSLVAADPRLRSLATIVVASVVDLRPVGWQLALRHLTQLQVLSLTGSPTASGSIGDEIWPALSNCTQLRQLRLDNNSVASIPDFLLTRLPSLRLLSLAANQVRGFTSAAFYAAADDLQVDLRHNAIASLASCSLAMFSSLRGVRLAGNPLTCDCSLLWLLRRLRDETPADAADARCHRPPELRDADWRSVDESQFCDAPAAAFAAGAGDCRVLTPSPPPTTTTTFAWGLDLRLARDGESTVVMETDAARLLPHFRRVAVRYGPAASFHTDASVVEADAASAARLRLPVASADVAYRFCVLLLVANDSGRVGNDANCRQLAPIDRPLPASTLFAIAAASGAALLLLLLLPLLICCLRRRKQLKQQQLQQRQQQQRQQHPEQYYTYLESETKANPRFQAARNPNSRQFTRRSASNLASSRPSLAGSASSLHRQSALQQQQQQQQQQQSSSLSRGLRHSQSAQLLDDPRLQYQQQEQLLHYVRQQQQQLQEQERLLARSTDQLAAYARLQRHCRSQENVLSAFQHDAFQHDAFQDDAFQHDGFQHDDERPPPLPERRTSARSFARVDYEAEDTYEEMQT